MWTSYPVKIDRFLCAVCVVELRCVLSLSGHKSSEERDDTIILGERYEVGEPLGREPLSTVYRGRDMHMSRDVAIKVLREVSSTDPKFVTCFGREAKAAATLQHRSIVHVYDYSHEAGNYYMVMEFILGTDLRRYLRAHGTLAVEEACPIATACALGLGEAHRHGIVHRSVSLQHVMIGGDGEVKITPLGMTLHVLGYSSPEQFVEEVVSPATDVYAFGMVLYEMLTGQPIFDDDSPVAVAMQHLHDKPLSPRQLNPNIPPSLEEIILRCLEKEPEKRYQDGNALASALSFQSRQRSGYLMMYD